MGIGVYEAFMVDVPNLNYGDVKQSTPYGGVAPTTNDVTSVFIVRMKFYS